MKLLPFDAHNHVHLGPQCTPWPFPSVSSSPPPPSSSLSPPLSSTHTESAKSKYSDNRMSIYYPSCDNNDSNSQHRLCGMAIMSTHPRDFARVLELASNSIVDQCCCFIIIPCIGVHPWFLHELDDDDDKDEDWWQPPQEVSSMEENNNNNNNNNNILQTRPRWIVQMEELLMEHPRMAVGEIGLDGFHFHFDPSINNNT